MSSVRVFIGFLYGGAIDGGLEIGRVGTGPGFRWFIASGFLMADGFRNAALWTFFLWLMAVGGLRARFVLICVW